MSDDASGARGGSTPDLGASAPLLSGFSSAPMTSAARPSGEFAVPEEHRYRAPQLLGVGGMGRVVAVHDRRLRRDVALKLPNPESPLAAQLDSRLAREARITARLDHPGILPILDAGVGVDGRSFYTMPIVRGRSLADVLRGTSDATSRLRYLRRVLEACEAVGWAHRQGIVHCDLKPANIMLGDGCGVRVLDWGLARLLEEDAPGAVIGTPQYMSPEQATGHPADPRSDVWSLGAILHEVCAGRPLRAPGSASEVLSRARAESRARTPTLELGADLSPELVAIITRALQPDPALRYEHAEALSVDLANLLDGRRVTAHAYSPRELLVRALRAWRVPLLVALGGVVVVLVLVALGMNRLADEAEQASLARGRAETSEARARQALEAASGDLARSLVSQALLRADKGARAEAEILAAHALANRESPAARGVLATWGAAPAPTLMTRTPLPECLAHSLHQAGTRLLCREERGLSAWAIRDDAPPALLWRRPGHVRSVAMAGDVLAVMTSHDQVAVLDPSNGALESEHTVPCDLRVYAYEGRIITSNNGCFWSVGAGEGSGTHFYPCDGHGLMGTFTVDAGRERWGALCEDGTLVQGLFLDEPERWTRTPTALHGKRIALAGAFLDDELVVGSGDGELVRLDTRTGAVLGVMATGLAKVVDLAVSDDGTLALVRASNGAIAIFEPRLGLVRGRLPEDRARTAVFVGHDVVVLGDDLRRYRVSRGMPHRYDLGSGVTSLAFDPDGRWLAATTGYLLDVRRLDDGTPLAQIGPFAGFIKSGTVTTSGAHFHITFSGRSASDPLLVRSWETSGWQPVPETALEFGPRRIVALADGTLLTMPYMGGLRIVVPEDELAVIWVAPTAHRFADLTTSPDGRFAVAIAEDGGDIVRITTGMWAVEPFGQDPTGRAVAIARDGVLAATAGDGGIQLWDADRGAPTGVIALPNVSLTRIAISPDMRWLAAGSRDGIVRLWELPTLRLIAQMSGHEERVSALAFTPDSHILATGSWDGFVRLFDLGRLLTPGAELAPAFEASWGRTLQEVLEGDASLAR